MQQLCEVYGYNIKHISHTRILPESTYFVKIDYFFVVFFFFLKKVVLGEIVVSGFGGKSHPHDHRDCIIMCQSPGLTSWWILVMY